MEFKVVMYLVIAIGWVIFNNYRKIVKEHEKRGSGKRTPSLPENWPSTSFPEPVPAPSSSKPVTVTTSSPKVLKPKLQKNIKKSTPRTSQPTYSNLPVEGGYSIPSNQVHFSEQNTADVPHPILEWLQSGTDWQKVLVGSEILQRPYH
ncbi:MAG TPA: hypothetical protein VFW78_02605 [Bacteroidia bacterium]|nr:hypothetical protein [Bacteroidia bacterium]